jgi:NAD(P)-dependent dehydrogenase (short-subunit alcohol dehydrogenase family)
MIAPRTTPAEFVNSLFGMQGRIAAITGAASGLGAAWAQGFARAGAEVMLLDRNRDGAEAQAGAIRNEGGTAHAVELDVTDAFAVEAFAQETAARLGRIDVLLNSAGGGFRCAGRDFPIEAFDKIISLNLRGTYVMCQSVGRLMLAAGSGCIINVASIGGLIAYPNASAYLASKGGVLQITRALALEWINRGVRVNAIAPDSARPHWSRASTRRATPPRPIISAGECLARN